MQALCDARYSLETCKQEQKENNINFYRTSKSTGNTYEYFGGYLATTRVIKDLKNTSDPGHLGDMPTTYDSTNPKDIYDALVDYFEQKEAYEQKV